MSILESNIMPDGGEKIYSQIVASMQNYPIFGGGCENPVYLLRYTNDFGIGQYAVDGEFCWTSVFTGSCGLIGRQIGWDLQQHSHSQLWALKVNADFFFPVQDTFRDEHFPVKGADLRWKGCGWEVIFYGVIPAAYLYNQPFKIGTDCIL